MTRPASRWGCGARSASSAPPVGSRRTYRALRYAGNAGGARASAGLPLFSQPPVQAAIALTLHPWSWRWGVTGSTGYALATEIPVLHAASDLDLLIRAPQPLDREALREWLARVAQLPCRADTQVETPYGAFAPNEWLRDGRALLKTSHGARLTATPWHREE